MKTITEMKIVLASGSPRRNRILKELGYEFKVKIPNINEDIIAHEKPEDHVLRLSKKKAKAVANEFENSLVIGADTIVVLDNNILGKPDSKTDAFNMLKSLSGKTHIVYSGICLLFNDIEIANYDYTTVVFNKLTNEQINSYIESGEPLDKAGSYGIQGMGSFLIKEYNGELDTVIGFPTKLFEKMLTEVRSCLNL